MWLYVFTLPHAIEAKINFPFHVFHSSGYLLFALHTERLQLLKYKSLL